MSGSENNDEIRPVYKTTYRVNALYAERCGWFKVMRAYVDAPTIEKAEAAAKRVFVGAKHIAVRLRVQKKVEGD